MMQRSFAVAEVQGLYGPFSFTEKLLQQIWLRGDFDPRAARLDDGRELRVIHPGKWNLLGGPDFKNARLAFGDGPEVTGDVELHLEASDWVNHAHAQDRAYDRVILHVVLFAPKNHQVTKRADGAVIPCLALLPLLPHDLEEFAADEAVEVMSGRFSASAPEELARLEPDALSGLLRDQARRRWRQKVHYAQVRSARLGWEAVCHHTALEILGYRFNRAPMLRVAGRWPLEAWREPAFDFEAVYLSEKGRWSLQGVRPANQPRVRLRQYAEWVRNTPDWPARLLDLPLLARTTVVDTVEAAAKGAAGENTRELRRRNCFSEWREKIRRQVCGGVVGGTRLDNLICDGLFPLVATASSVPFDFGIWFHWFPGDQPPVLTRVLRQLGVCHDRGQPACHGFAQGLLGWFLEREARR